MSGAQQAWSGVGARDHRDYADPAAGEVVDGMGPSVARTGSGRRSPPLKNGSELRAAGYLVAVGSRTARFRRAHQWRAALVALLALLLLLLCLVITLSVLYARARRSRPAAVCSSRACLRSAANLALTMDPDADPCTDFYQFACGKWSMEHPRPDGLRSYDWFREKQSRVYARVRDVLTRNLSDDAPRALSQASLLYAACMDTETLEKRGLQPVLETLQSLRLDARPAALTAMPAGPFDWLAAAVRVKTTLAMDVLVGFDIFTDPRNSSRYRLVMGSPETIDPFPSMHKHQRKRHTGRRSIISRRKPEERARPRRRRAADEEAERAAAAYRRYYADLMRAMLRAADGADADPTDPADLADPADPTDAPVSTPDPEQDHDLQQKILQAADHYYIFSDQLYELESSNDTEADEDLYAHVPEYTAAELLALTGGGGEGGDADGGLWARYLTGVFADTGVTLDLDTDTVLVSEPDLKYLVAMTALVESTPPATVQLYVWMKVVEVMSEHTTREMRQLATRAREEAAGEAAGDGGELPPRGLHCAGAATDMLPFAVAYAIADPHFLNDTKPKILSMLEEMKVALASLVGRARWMDDNTKLATYGKIKSMRSLVGYPDWLHRPGALDDHYADVNVDPAQHLHNMIHINQVRVRKVLASFRDANNFTWATDPTEVNAYHTFQENTISRQFDKDGNLIPWWSNETVSGFLNVTQCFVDQYNDYYLPELDEHVDGRRTLGENLADNGGVREALLALRRRLRKRTEPTLPGFDTYTPEQLFFLSYGNLWCGSWTRASLSAELRDEHAPQRLRAAGVLHNNADFAAAWRCPPQAPMNPRPQHRCIIF